MKGASEGVNLYSTTSSVIFSIKSSKLTCSNVSAILNKSSSILSLVYALIGIIGIFLSIFLIRYHIY